MSELLERLADLVQISQKVPPQIDELQACLQSLDESVKFVEGAADTQLAETQVSLGQTTARLGWISTQIHQREAVLQQSVTAGKESLTQLNLTQRKHHSSLIESMNETESRLKQLQQAEGEFRSQLNALTASYAETVSQGVKQTQAAWLELEQELQEASNGVAGFDKVVKSAVEQQSSAMKRWVEASATTRADLAGDLRELREEGALIESRFRKDMTDALSAFTWQADLLDRRQSQSLEAGVSRPCDEGVRNFTEQAVLFMGQQSAIVEDKLIPIGVDVEKQVKRYQQGLALKPMLATTYYFLQKIGQDSIMTPYLELILQDV